MLLVLVGVALAAPRWVAEPVSATRWPDVTVTTIELRAGDEVELVLTDGAKARVRKGADFGWVNAAALVATPPQAPGLPPLDVSGLPEAPG